MGTANTAGYRESADRTTLSSSAQNEQVEEPVTGRVGRRALRRTGKVAISLVVPAVGLGLWQYVGQQKLLAGGLFPSVSESARALWDFLVGVQGSTSPYSGKWLDNVAASSYRIVVGYAIGAAWAIILGLMAGYFETVRRAVDPTINALRPVAITAWVPLTLIVLGIGDEPAIFLTALATFYPVYISTFVGASYADGGLVRAAKMLGASRLRILRSVTFPASLPSIAAGLRVALALAWTCVVITEMLGARTGIGYVLIQSYNQFRLDYVVACMFTLGLLGVVSELLLKALLKTQLRWAAAGARS